MHMPLMMRLQNVVVFGGERGEGLQKTEKLALYADSVLVVPEQAGGEYCIEFPAGPVQHVAEKLTFSKSVTVCVAPRSASRWNIGHYLHGADFVCSDLADRRLNELIWKLCQKRGIRCNIIDTKDLGDVWFMSLVDVPGLLVGISSRGECAYASRAAREDLHEVLENQGRISLVLSQARKAFLEARRDVAARGAGSIGSTPPKGALAMLEALNHHPEFQAGCKTGDWEATLGFALAFAQGFAASVPAVQ